MSSDILKFIIIQMNFYQNSVKNYIFLCTILYKYVINKKIVLYCVEFKNLRR